MAKLSRRAFFTRLSATPEVVSPVRPPWTTEQRIEDKCIGCFECVKACPEAILFSADNRPYLKTGVGECTFCEECAKACPEEGLFDLTVAPWRLTAEIQQGACLLGKGVSCQTCTDSCDPRALRFDMRVAPTGKIQLDADQCNGCGACLISCPVDAIVMNDQSRESLANA
ncbi:Electron transport complex subunit RsxB [Pseudovibrio sp. Ad46]|uniref:ferredoxin-type protein NapF n=1 Tax=unclassified Pseudovibrio TaxID=2627060 RepID=UPI0007102124|nr:MULTISPECIES: ferredoxin-type protein NapF [unclassified Pseudovibrio]KZK90497.1 Electron transport complex subunit RsxB [Pseudovibrio sp. Ad46]KZK92781.1 Electron transport complex subunit RsxB [Pseudovibrio sp. Ad5]